jgi:hypothetical protein
MLTKEALVQYAGETAPALMQKTAAVLVQVEQESPEDVAWVARELDAISEHTFDKIAEMGAWGKWGLAVGTGVAAGIANDLAGDLYSSAKRGLSKSRNLRAIMKVNPDLKAMDKHRLQMSFDAIHRYAPEMTADPLVGGALLKSVADVSGNEGVAIKNIIDMRKNVVNPFRPGESIKYDKPEVHKGPTAGEVSRDAKLRAVGELHKGLMQNIDRDKDLRKDPKQLAAALKKQTSAFSKQVDSLAKK